MRPQVRAVPDRSDTVPPLPDETPARRGAVGYAPRLATLVQRSARTAVTALTAVIVVALVVAAGILLVLRPEARRADAALEALQQGRLAMVDQETGVRAYVSTGDRSFLEPYLRGRRDLAAARTSLQRIRHSAQASHALADRLSAVLGAQRRWEDQWADPYASAPPAIDDVDALSAVLERGKLLFDDYRAHDRRAIAYVVLQRDRATHREAEALVSGILLDLVIGLTVIGAVMLSNRRLRGSLMPAVERTRTTLHRLSTGDLSARVEPSGPYELRRIAGDVNSLADALAGQRLLTEQREGELVAARHEAERAGAAKATFLATMSHEIRTPLNAVIGLADLVLASPLTPEQREQLTVLSRSGDTLLGLVNDVLDFSRIEAGGLDLQDAPFDLHELVYGSVDMVLPQVASSAVDLLVDIADDVPRMVRGDGSRMEQVLLNLIGNAAKFTVAGEIVVSVSVLPAATPADPDLVEIVVRDTGQGIEPDALSTVFEDFWQADASSTRTQGGAGLGLAIVQTVIDAMQGSVTVTSTPGVGSAFSVRLPLPALGPARSGGERGTTDALPLAGLRLLVVDDNATNRRILDGQLRRHGARCVTAASAIEALARLDEDDGFDAAILDLHMPVTDGVGLAEAIVARNGAAIPLLLLSSGVPDPSAHRYFRARLRKPTHPAPLVRAVAQVAGRALPGAPEPDAPAAPEQRPGVTTRVLVAEDHPVNQRLMLSYLDRLGYSADVVGDGLAAVEAVRVGSYPIVLMDGQMPVMSGVEATRTIRGLDVAQPLILAVTASAFTGDRDAFLAAGADAFLTKPLRLSTLAQALSVASPVCAAAQGDGPVADSSAAVLDRDTLADLRTLGPETFARLVGDFAARLPGHARAIGEAAHRGEALDRPVHTLKGSSGSYGAVLVAETCVALERQDLAPEQRERLVVELVQRADAAHRAFLDLLAPGVTEQEPPGVGAALASAGGPPAADDW